MATQRPQNKPRAAFSSGRNLSSYEIIIGSGESEVNITNGRGLIPFV